MTYLKRPADIYRQSFSIIEKEADLRRFSPDQVPLAVRLVHACGMPDIVDDLVFSPMPWLRERQHSPMGRPLFATP